MKPGGHEPRDRRQRQEPPHGLNLALAQLRGEEQQGQQEGQRHGPCQRAAEAAAQVDEVGPELGEVVEVDPVGVA